jgi:hypothetical protein
MTTEHCPVIEMVDELLSLIEVYEIPSDFVPMQTTDYHFASILRHKFTNYDYLLHERYEEVGELPTAAVGLQILCFRHIFENGGECVYWDGMDCPTLEKVYFELKWTATERAKEAYRRWQEQQGK